MGFINSQRNKLTRRRLLLQERTGCLTLEPLRCQIKKPESSGLSLFKNATALLELEQELGARPWNEVADERRVGLTRALLGVRRGRRIIERVELQLRDLEREARDLRRGA